ncbi:MAG: sulfatase [Planctomyces sp.]|nr:sulfatase [Planctomyces sp.]
MRLVCMLFCLAANSLHVQTCDAFAGRDRPNIVFFIADDLGPTDLGCYGSSFYETPHLDQLARDGARFLNAYAACPVCSPTRASIITGRYPQRTGITDYIGAAQPKQWKRNTAHLPAPYTERLALEETTIAEVLKSAGYATFFAGKWHLGDEGFLPEDQGFDVNYGGLARGGPYGGDKYFSPYGNSRLKDGPKGEHLPDRLATEACGFMEAHRDESFLIYFPFYDVHTPLISREDLKRKYEQKRSTREQVDVFSDEPPRKVRMSQDHAIYAGMVDAMDQAVGKVLSKLDELGLRGNTLVIFTSDNGGLSTSEGSPTSNAPHRAGKGWLYEGGIRTVLLMRWPGVIPSGHTEESPAISPDYFPTIMDAARIPRDESLQLDGISLLPILSSNAASPHRSLYWHYPHYGNQGGAPGAAIIHDDWKLIEWFETNQLELFNLRNDPEEKHNVAVENPEMTAALLQKLKAWQADVGAIRSTPNPAYDPTAKSGRL